MRYHKKKTGGVRWDLRGPISSAYLAHCSHLFFTSIRIVLLASYIYAISESCDTYFAGWVVYKPWVLSMSTEALVLITVILMAAVDCVLSAASVCNRAGYHTFNVMVLKCTHYITHTSSPGKLRFAQKCILGEWLYNVTKGVNVSTACRKAL